MKISFRAQSAMEYLMTYGWAILIIAVVLGVLFQMGVFNSSSSTVRVPAGACKVLRTSAAVNLVGQCSGILPKYVAMFDGQSGYVSTSNHYSKFSAPATTISAWIYGTDWAQGTDRGRWIAGDYGGNYRGTEFFVNTGGQLCFEVANPSSQYQLCPSSPLSLNTWYFVAATFDGTNMYVYINGVQSGGPVAGQLGTAMTPFYIGEEEWATGYFAGFISNVQVYNSSLDQSQIQTLYLEGIGGAPVNPQYLVGWWPLNGDTKDYSGYNNNGAPAVVTFISQYGK